LDDSYLIFFVGENSPPLDSSYACEYVGTARNIGFVKLSKDMDAILSSGASGDEENGGFYTFGGEWSA